MCIHIDIREFKCRRGTQRVTPMPPLCSYRTVAVCCSVLRCVAVCCSVLQCVAVCYMLRMCCVSGSVLQGVAGCCCGFPYGDNLMGVPPLRSRRLATRASGDKCCRDGGPHRISHYWYDRDLRSRRQGLLALGFCPRVTRVDGNNQ